MDMPAAHAVGNTGSGKTHPVVTVSRLTLIKVAIFGGDRMRLHVISSRGRNRISVNILFKFSDIGFLSSFASASWPDQIECFLGSYGGGLLAGRGGG